MFSKELDGFKTHLTTKVYNNFDIYVFLINNGQIII